MTASLYKAAIFDLDGTLLDSLDELGIACNTILEQKGLATHPLARYAYFVGEGAETLIRRALGEKASDTALVNQCLNDYLIEYRAICGRHAGLYPGISGLLQTLVSRGLKLAVLSNKPHDLTLTNIDLFLKDVPFESVLGQRNGIPKKPDPHGAFEILEYLGVEPARCLYLGDTAIDMKTAVSAGMYPVGVLWGFRDKDELLDGGAKTLIEKPEELLKLL